MPTTIPGSGRWGDFERQQQERQKKAEEQAAKDAAEKLKQEQADYAKNNLARPPEEKYEIPAALARPPAEYQQLAAPPRERQSFTRALPYLLVGGGILWYFMKKRNE